MKGRQSPAERVDALIADYNARCRLMEFAAASADIPPFVASAIKDSCLALCVDIVTTVEYSGLVERYFYENGKFGYRN